MKAYQIKLFVIDMDEIGPGEIKTVLEDTRYPNRCISPEVMGIKQADIGEWHDGHPLNLSDKSGAEMCRLFPDNNVCRTCGAPMSNDCPLCQHLWET